MPPLDGEQETRLTYLLHQHTARRINKLSSSSSCRDKRCGSKDAGEEGGGEGSGGGGGRGATTPVRGEDVELVPDLRGETASERGSFVLEAGDVAEPSVV